MTNFRTLTQHAAAVAACCVLGLAAPASAQSIAPSGTIAPPTSALDAARQNGDIDRMRQIALQRDDSEALAARAELALLDADIAGAKRYAQTAVERATTDDDRAWATTLLARAHFASGDAGAAEELLRGYLSERPQAHRVRLELGQTLVARGAASEGEVILDAFSTFYNNGLLKTSKELTILSKAMATIGSFDDANFAMERAIEKDPRNTEALVHWGNLLLDKYNTADAEVTFDEALTINSKNPDALLGKARVELELTNDYPKIRELLTRVESIAPEHVGMLLTHAEIAIYDTDCEAARGYAGQVLDKRPRQLEALTILTACDYLDDDRAAFERRKKAVLAIHPSYAPVLTETAKYSVRVHRYEEAVKLNEQALDLRPDYAPAMLGMGIGLSRTGDEERALEMLRRAFEADPYNVRAYNMVELYETQMRDYEFVDHDRYLLRAHRSEREIIDALVAPVVDEALTAFDDKYAFQPAEDYLAVEVFPNPTTFAVRSVGLPHVSPHGICFGKVVVSRSPSDGNFNWRQVIWHELAHVYHIQLSNSRVPRWFTEGLAEYETNVKDAAWSRHHDRELASALNADNLRGVLELSEGFTHARSFEEILRSYHQSSLVIHFIAQTWGFETLPKMLRTWGSFKNTTEVLAEVLSVTPDEFDVRFKTWLTRKYLNFQRQLTVDLASLPPVAELKQGVDEHPEDAMNWAKLAIGHYRVGDAAAADMAMSQAISRARDNATVRAVAALYFFDRGRVKDAYEQGIEVLESGRDSYELRILLGTAAMGLEDPITAGVHYQAAATLWEDGIQAWAGLEKVARATDDDELAQRAQRRIFMLDQNDAQVARQYTEASREAGDWNAALTAARRWVDINPLDSRSQEALIEAATQAGRPEAATWAWAALAVLRPSDSADILLGAIRTLSKAGKDSAAAELADRARRDDIPESRIREALKR